MSIESVSQGSSTQAVAASNASVAENDSKETKSAPESDDSGEISDESDTSEEGSESENEESEPQDEEAGDEKPKKQSGFKKKIGKLTSKLTAKEKEAEFWKAEALKSRENPAKTQEPVKPQVSESKPKAEDFETYEEYTEALTDWKIEDREVKKEAKLKEAQVQKEFQSRTQEFQSKVAEFAKEHDDWDDALEDVEDINVPIALNEVIISSDIGPALMYELAKNRAELERICKMSPLAAAREIGKLEARLAKPSTDSSEKRQLKSNAPPPISPVGSKSGTVKRTIYDANLPFAEFERLRKDQLKSKQ